MITTPDHTLAGRMRLLALHGMSRDAWKGYTSVGTWHYDVLMPGYKDNMTDIQAALGIHQLRKLDGFVEARQSYARQYDQAFADLPEIMTPILRRNRNHVYHLYIIRLAPSLLAIDRAQFIEELKTYNIGTSVHFIPVHLHSFYRERFGYGRGDLPHAEAIFDSCISLPLYPKMTQRDVMDVIAAVRQIVAQHSVRMLA